MSICAAHLAPRTSSVLNVPLPMMRKVYDGIFFNDGIAVRTTIQRIRKSRLNLFTHYLTGPP